MSGLFQFGMDFLSVSVCGSGHRAVALGLELVWG